MKPSCRDELFYDDQFKTETEELLVGQKVTGKSSQIQITFKTRRYEVLMNTKLQILNKNLEFWSPSTFKKFLAEGFSDIKVCQHVYPQNRNTHNLFQLVISIPKISLF